MKARTVARLIAISAALAITITFAAVWAYADLIDNGDGTITDTGSRLVWLKNANNFGLQYFEAATQKAQGVGSQWRLPTKEELVARAADTSVFANVQKGSYAYYWTSNVFVFNYTLPGSLIPSSGYAVTTVRMSDGATSSAAAGTPSPGATSTFFGCYVWPVRNK